MKYYLLLLFTVFFICPKVFCQNKKTLDSLQIVYNTAKHDTTKVMALTDIANLYRNGKPDTCISIAEKALQMSEKIGFEKGKGWAWNRMGIGYRMKSKYSEALALYQKALHIFEKIDNKQGIVNCFHNIGIIYQSQGNYPLALEYYQKSLKSYEEIGEV